jgi:hypothetical protein
MKIATPILVAGCFAAFAATASAKAETLDYSAILKGSTEVPANTTAGNGSVNANIDTATRKMSYTVDYTGLTGPATAAHFHGPAAAGANAPPIVTVSGDLKSPIKGEATLTDAQLKDFADGKIYFNVHTDANKNGEIRGQLARK